MNSKKAYQLRKPRVITTLVMVLLSVSSERSFAQTPVGFVQQENVKVAGITTDAQLYPLSLTQKQVSRIYTDGLGRTLQSIGIQASPLQNDLIQPVAYDNLGRQTIAYLPYAGKSTDVAGSYRANSIGTDQANFYNNSSQYLIATDNSPYAQQVFENSPLQRLLTTGMVGSGYQPGGTGTQHYKTINYRTNASTDGNILIWNADGTFTANNYYAAGTLTVTTGTDEDNTQTTSFSDLSGRQVLKRQILSSGNLDTYYIYNMAGMLSFIIPPKATSLLSANSYNLSAAPLSNLVFYFTYDGRGRAITKTVPAKGQMSIVYDALSRPVLMQDANMLANNQWNYIKYDVKGRVISQGFYTDNTTTPTSHIGQVNMQAYVNTLNYATNWYEARSATVTNGGYYTNNVFPTTGITALAYSYYDDYDLNLDGTSEFTYTSQGLSGEIGATAAPLKGMPTIVSKTTVGSGLTNTWLTTAIFYDKRGNAIQIKNNNQVYYNGATTLTDTKTTVSDFSGVPQVSKVIKQTGASTTITVQTTLTYDHMYRLNSVSQQYNGGSVLQVAAYTYNELGQPIKKGLGYVNSTTWLQTVDLRYNIRGQLTSLNNSKLSSDGGQTNSGTNDVFGMQFLYDQADANLGNTAYFNGKLSAVKWMSKDGSGNSSYERSYSYSYDQINRYTGQTYAERTAAGTGAFSNNLHGFDEKVTGYDNAGNITNLTRNSSTQGTNSNVQIDNLAYTYSTTNPYQLLSVTDGTGANYTGAGFRNYTGSTGNYTYDADGNLKTDPYKGLTLNYNYLNRTDKTTVTTSTGRYINYTYDAGGSLIRKQSYDNNTLQTTTDYVDGFLYINSTLSYFPMPEGRVLNVSGTLKQEFVISDQQGNARVSFQDNGSGVAVVKQENSYYGFGMVLPNSPVATPTVSNKQLYNGGSEWQNDYSNLPDYYQTYNRNYDAAIGRFVGVDPVAESAADMTSYQYAGNNPIMYNDPWGNLIKTPPTATGGSLSNQLFGLFGSNEGISGDLDRLDNEQAEDEAFNLYHQYLTDLAGGGGDDGNESSADDAQAAAILARDAAGNVGGPTSTALLGQINSLIQPYASDLAKGEGTVSYSGGELKVTYQASGDYAYLEGHGKYSEGEIIDITSGEIHGVVHNLSLFANQGGHERNEISEGYSKAFDATAFATDFHGVSLTSATTFLKDVGEPVLKYNRGVGAVGAVASLATVGVHLYNHQATWKDGVTGTLGVANLVLIAIPGIGEAAVGLELTVALGTLAWDAYNQYEDAHRHNK